MLEQKSHAHLGLKKVPKNRERNQRKNNAAPAGGW